MGVNSEWMDSTSGSVSVSSNQEGSVVCCLIGVEISNCPPLSSQRFSCQHLPIQDRARFRVL